MSHQRLIRSFGCRMLLFLGLSTLAIACSAPEQDLEILTSSQDAETLAPLSDYRAFLAKLRRKPFTDDEWKDFSDNEKRFSLLYVGRDERIQNYYDFPRPPSEMLEDSNAFPLAATHSIGLLPDEVHLSQADSFYTDTTGMFPIGWETRFLYPPGSSWRKPISARGWVLAYHSLSIQSLYETIQFLQSFPLHGTLVLGHKSEITAKYTKSGQPIFPLRTRYLKAANRYLQNCSTLRPSATEALQIQISQALQEIISPMSEKGPIRSRYGYVQVWPDPLGLLPVTLNASFHPLEFFDYECVTLDWQFRLVLQIAHIDELAPQSLDGEQIQVQFDQHKQPELLASLKPSFEAPSAEMLGAVEPRERAALFEMMRFAVFAKLNGRPSELFEYDVRPTSEWMDSLTHFEIGTFGDPPSGAMAKNRAALKLLQTWVMPLYMRGVERFAAQRSYLESLREIQQMLVSASTHTRQTSQTADIQVRFVQLLPFLREAANSIQIAAQRYYGQEANEGAISYRGMFDLYNAIEHQGVFDSVMLPSSAPIQQDLNNSSAIEGISHLIEERLYLVDSSERDEEYREQLLLELLTFILNRPDFEITAELRVAVDQRLSDLDMRRALRSTLSATDINNLTPLYVHSAQSFRDRDRLLRAFDHLVDLIEL